MPQRLPMLEARAPHRVNAGGQDMSVDPRGVPARTDMGPSVIRLQQQARDQLVALGAALASWRSASGAVPSQLTALARTIERIGAKAQRLEREAERMRHYAYHDPLTGLPNRSLLLDRLDRALAQAARRGGEVALLMFDLDEFKLVNDRFGHVVGDQLLQGVAERLQRSTRDADTICRYGGDEFVLLLPEADGRQGATAVALKIQTELAAPFLLDGHSITVSACIGIALYPMDGSAPSQLLQRADVAMYGAKDDPLRRHLPQDCERPAGGVAGRSARRLHEVVSGSETPGAANAAGETDPGRLRRVLCERSNVDPDPPKWVPG